MAGKRSQSRGSSPTSGNFSDDGGSSTTTTIITNKDQERFLPIANVSRIMKKSLPASAKISKEAKETIQECVSEFISFVTGEASDKCRREKRKTVNSDDLLWAMTTLGFESYVGPLKVARQKKIRSRVRPPPMAASLNNSSNRSRTVLLLLRAHAVSAANYHRYMNGAGDGGGGPIMMSGPMFSMGRPAHQSLDLHGYHGPPAGTASWLVYTLGVHPHQAAAISAARFLGYSNGAGAVAHQFN